MGLCTFKDKVLKEVQLIPESKLEELYDVIRFFRIGVEASKEQTQEIMKFAGCWSDMSDEAFSDLSKELKTRRHKAFSGRIRQER